MNFYLIIYNDYINLHRVKITKQFLKMLSDRALFLLVEEVEEA